MVIQRIEGWPLLLSRFLRVRREMPFAWGSNDCLIFAADCVLALAGVDPAERWRGYATEAEAAAILAANGGVNALIADGLGHKGQRNMLTARRGDIVTMKLDGRLTAGVVDDSGTRIASVAEKGMTRLPLTKAWRIWSY